MAKILEFRRIGTTRKGVPAFGLAPEQSKPPQGGIDWNQVFAEENIPPQAEMTSALFKSWLS